jgi:hypothetical protein
VGKYNGFAVAMTPEQRKEVNKKIIRLINTGSAEQAGITREDIFNAYTGNGGLHGLNYGDYANYHEYGEAKKEIERGQFFTPDALCEYISGCVGPESSDIIYDLTHGMGNFFNHLPVESNIYGSELDAEAFKVARYLYPGANLENEDIRTYRPPVKADIVFGNPPFNLKWKINDGEEVLSQNYYCAKAAEVLKPGGLLALIVPSSFLADELFDKTAIEQIESLFSFILRFDISPDAFKSAGVENFNTKVMIWQRRSKYLKHNKYDHTSKIDIAGTEASQIYENYVKPFVLAKKAQASRIYFENSHNNLSDNLEFQAATRKLLYDISRNKSVKNRLGECESILHTYLDQKKPDKMSYEEWEKTRVKNRDVLDFIREALRSAGRKKRSGIRFIKTGGAFIVRDDDRKSDGVFATITGAVLGKPEFDNGIPEAYRRMIRRKRKAYLNQSQSFDSIKPDADIAENLKAWRVFSQERDEELRLTDVQARDVNKLLQKKYGILQYSMGAGKTLCALAMISYSLEFMGERNAFVVSAAIAVNNTWEIVLKDYGINYRRINTIADVDNLRRGEIALLTLDAVCKLRKHLRRYVKRNSYKVMLIFDESDAISNPFSKRTKAILSAFRRVRRKYLTTGTTTRNNICEIAPQLELLYNNSINYLSMCEYITVTNKKGEQEETANDYYGQPFPAWRSGYDLFAASHLPKKLTVFGIDQKTQDIYNSAILKDILDKTVITKSFAEVTGKQIYEIKQEVVGFSPAERAVYFKAISEFEEMRRQYFQPQANARKDSLLRILQQLILLLKVCANPAEITGYNSDETPTKVKKIIELLGDWRNERVAIGARHVSVVHSYADYIRKAFPDRKIFVVTGGEDSFKDRRETVAELERTPNGILISTQQALSASTNIDFVDKVIIPELHYNNAAMAQYYFRFIRFTSKNWKQVYFVTYKDSIESNLLKLVLVKEKFNLFMKNDEVDDDELYDRFGVDPAIINNLMAKDKDENGNVYIRWGEQKIS